MSNPNEPIDYYTYAARQYEAGAVNNITIPVALLAIADQVRQLNIALAELIETVKLEPTPRPITIDKLAQISGIPVSEIANRIQSPRPRTGDQEAGDQR